MRKNKFNLILNEINKKDSWNEINSYLSYSKWIFLKKEIHDEAESCDPSKLIYFSFEVNFYKYKILKNAF